MVQHLVQSILLILALCWLQSVNTRFWRTRVLPGRIMSGVLFGTIAGLGMLEPVWLAPGMFLDARLAVLGMASLFGGPLAGGIALLITASCRLGFGGDGALPGVAAMLFTYALGLAYREAIVRGWARASIPQLLCFGLLIHAFALLLLLGLVGLSQVRTQLLTIMAVLPAITLLLAILLQDMQRHSEAGFAQEESEARLRAITRAIPDLLLVLDEDGRYLDIVSPGQHRSLLYGEASSLQGKLMHDVLPGQKADRFLAFVRQALASGVPETIEYTLETGNVLRTFEGRAQALDVSRDGKRAVLMVARDITAHKAAETEIRQLAFFDPLTGLPNRRRLIDLLTRMQAQCAREGCCAALFRIDLDDFRKINDLRGTAAGDQILQQVAVRLQNFIRHPHTVAHVGGDQFAVLLGELPSHPAAAHMAAAKAGEQLLIALREPYPLGPNMQFSSGSIGIVLFGARLTADELLQQAELAMYAAKDAGKDTLHFFDPAFQEAVNARLLLEEQIRQGLLRHEFQLLYQPQFDRLGHMTGAEALVRWDHPQHGIMVPGRFIDAAEQAGLLQQLDNWVLGEACRQLAEWGHDPVLRQVPVSVNISAVQLHQGNFASHVTDMLRQSGAPPQRLMLELTESVLVCDMSLAISHMETLKALGVRFALDDFGTGYSSLSYLQQLPLDELKIDQSFVRRLPDDAGSEVIIRAITALADSFGFEVIAEGVETDAQYEILASNGCQHYQGHLFARAMPAEALQAFARTLMQPER